MKSTPEQGGTAAELESIVKQGRFAYVVYVNGEYVVELNMMHPGGEYSMNLRGKGATVNEASLDLQQKLTTVLP